MEVIAIPPRSIAAFSRRTPARGALATVLCGAACAVLPASLYAQTPAVSPTLGTSITTQWSDFAAPAAGSDQITGLAAAAAPNGAVDAFEFAGGSPTLAASRTRAQGGEWTDHPGTSPIGKFDKIINVSRSSYGTLIARLVTTNIYAVSIRRRMAPGRTEMRCSSARRPSKVRSPRASPWGRRAPSCSPLVPASRWACR